MKNLISIKFEKVKKVESRVPQ